jgi:FixJ family two-component response regulator
LGGGVGLIREWWRGIGFWGSVRVVLGVPNLPTVHVVDDEPSVRKAVSRLLRAAGYDVAIYESAEQLLDRLPEKSESGCILLDVLMPGASGPAMRERLERIGSTLPILFMTGSVEPIEGDPEAFLKKPVSKEELLNAIERALGSIRAAE